MNSSGNDPRIEDYLDHVCAPLVGRVAYDERVALRTELRTHLEALVAASQEVGLDADAAIASALARFGPPRALATEWLRAWGRGGSVGVPSARPATLVALRWFGLASSLAYAMLLGMATGNLSPYVVLLTVFSAPIFAGFATGMRAPNRHALGVFYALAGIVGPVGLAAGLLPVDPMQDVNRMLTEFCQVQALFWIPVGCATSALGGWLRTRRDGAPRHWSLPA